MNQHPIDPINTNSPEDEIPVHHMNTKETLTKAAFSFRRLVRHNTVPLIVGAFAVAGAVSALYLSMSDSEIRRKAVTSPVAFAFSPANLEAQINSTLSTDVVVTAPAEGISALKIVVDNPNPEVITLKDVQATLNNFKILEKTITPEKITFTISSTCTENGCPLLMDTQTVARIHFATKTADPATLILSNSQAAVPTLNVNQANQFGTLALALTATPTPVSTPLTPTPDPTTEPSPEPGTNDTTKPVVTITSLEDGQIVDRKQTVTITANATDDTGVTRVVMTGNEKPICELSQAPFTCSFDMPANPNYGVRVRVEAYDAAGNYSFEQITVTTDGTPPGKKN